MNYTPDEYTYRFLVNSQTVYVQEGRECTRDGSNLLHTIEPIVISEHLSGMWRDIIPLLAHYLHGDLWHGDDVEAMARECVPTGAKPLPHSFAPSLAHLFVKGVFGPLVRKVAFMHRPHEGSFLMIERVNSKWCDFKCAHTRQALHHTAQRPHLVIRIR